MSIYSVKVNNTKRLNAYYWSLVVLCILIVGLRHYSVGTDTANYRLYFLFPQNGYNRGQNIELGFQYWTYLIKSLTDNYQSFFLLSAVISFVPLAYAILKLTKYKIIALLFVLFSITASSLFFFELSGMRQSIAISFFVLATYFLLKNGLCLKTMFVLLLSGLFHNSSILCIIILLVLFYIRKPINKSWGLGLIIGSMFFYNIFLEYFVSWIQLLSMNLSGDVQILQYGASGIEELYDRRSYLVMVIPFSVLSIFALKANKKALSVFQNNYIIITTMLINLFVAFPIGFRIVLYLIPLFVLFIVNVFMQEKLYRIILICVFCVFTYRNMAILVAQSNSINLNGNIVVPYKTSIF